MATPYLMGHVLRLVIETADYIPAFNPCGLVAWCGATFTGIVMMNIPSVSGFSAPATFVFAYAVYELGLRFAREEWYVARLKQQ